MIMEEVHANEGLAMNLMALADMCDPQEDRVMHDSMIGVDDVIGEWIEPDLIRKARSEEMSGFQEHEVYHRPAQRGRA